MEESLFRDLKESLEDAVAYEKGKPNKCRICKTKMSDPANETEYLSSIPGMKKTIEDGLKTSISNCIPDNKVSW